MNNLEQESEKPIEGTVMSPEKNKEKIKIRVGTQEAHVPSRESVVQKLETEDEYREVNTNQNVLEFEEKKGLGKEEALKNTVEAEKDVGTMSADAIRNPNAFIKGFEVLNIANQKEFEKDPSALAELKSKKPEMAKNVEIMKTFATVEKYNEFIAAKNKVGELLNNKKYIEAFGEANSYLQKLSANLAPEQKDYIKRLFVDKELQEKIGQELKISAEKLTDKKTLTKIASVGADFVPVLGPMKQLYETCNGTTLDGEKLEGNARIQHGIEGTLFLILDATGGGMLASKVAKGTLESGRILTRMAAAMRTAEVGRDVYSAVFKAGRWLISHPEEARAVNRVVRETINQRKLAGRVAQTAVNEI